MRKICTSLLGLWVAVAVFLTFASAEENLFVPTLMTNYAIWCDLMGVSGFSEDIDSKILDEDTSMMYMDNLAAASNRHTLEFEYAYLMYKYPGFSDIDMDTRALALFAAIEIGKPDEFTKQNIRDARKESIQILNQLKTTLQEKDAMIQNGQIVTFYIGKSVVYSIFQTKDGQQAIYIE